MSSEKPMTLDRGTIIQCKDLGKCYQIYNAPKDRLKQAIWRGRRQYFHEFWALRRVNFQVRRGESLGIIGRNGSGKSTLLQLICGTLTPTEGKIQTQGRIAALLELGSGFNPEFTGIENVYLNASMLGLSKEKTDAKIEDILTFADIGTFVNQPVKTYSSGMVVRLAFAVIAHVDADILVVDEALAVGDAIFVQRCMRFIRRMREERCLLFVSHDSEAVKSLCNEAIWLSEGTIKNQGSCKSVAHKYLRFCQAETYGDEIRVQALENESLNAKLHSTITKKTPNQREPDEESVQECISYESEGSLKDNLLGATGWKTGYADLIEVKLRQIQEYPHSELFKGGEKTTISVRAKANKHIQRPIIGFIVKDRLGQDLFGENTLFASTEDKISSANPGDVIEASFSLIMPMLPSGDYTVMASIADGDIAQNIQHHWVEDAILIRVTSSRVRYGLVGVPIHNIHFKVTNNQ